MDKEYLTYHYQELGKTTREIAKENGCDHLAVLRKLHAYGIATRGSNPRKQTVIVKCAYCSKPIERRPSTQSKNNFCNYEHYHLWLVGKNTGENSVNWKGGITAISSNNLKTPEFSRLKKVVLARMPVCAICGDDKFRHVHHIKTRKEYPELCFELNNLITLCRSCHAKIKGKENVWEDYFVGLVEKVGELLETPNVKTRAISSQAPEGKGSGEGSETTRVSPNNNLSHECPPRKGRYSPSCMDNMQKQEIKSSCDNRPGFMVDSKQMKEYLLWINRIDPDVTTEKDFDSMMFKQAVYARFGYGFTDWRFVYGHSVS